MRDDLTFVADKDMFEWLIVSGHRARFKGSGQINRAGDYGFMLNDQAAGNFPAGCVTKPEEVSSVVQDGTAAALRAIQIAR